MVDLSDAVLQSYLGLAAKATDEPWVVENVPLDAQGYPAHRLRIYDNKGFGVAAMTHPNRHTHKETAAFIAASRSLGPALAEEVLALRAFKEAVREKVILKAYLEWRRCILCLDTWKDGEPESHDASCPLAEKVTP